MRGPTGGSGTPPKNEKYEYKYAIVGDQSTIFAVNSLVKDGWEPYRETPAGDGRCLIVLRRAKQ